MTSGFYEIVGGYLSRGAELRLFSNEGQNDKKALTFLKLLLLTQ